MADFRIDKTVWLNGRPYKRGAEDQLVADGFTLEQKHQQLRRRAIAMLDATPVVPVSRSADALVDATDSARELAAEHGIDLRALSGTGAGGRITKGDVQSAVDALP